VRLAGARKEHPQVVDDLGQRAHGRAPPASDGLLVDGDRRGQPLDSIDVRLLHLPEELARVSGQRLEEAPLPFAEQRVERQRRLA